jgi:hypothetical protein
LMRNINEYGKSKGFLVINEIWKKLNV